MNNRKVKNFLLFPKFQITLIFFNLGLTLFTGGFCLWKIFNSFGHLKGVGKKLGLRPESAYFKLLNVQESLINRNIYIALAVATVLGIVLTLVFSHRAVGPIYRLKIYFDQYKNGDRGPLKFRKGDHFSELAEKVNAILPNG